MDLLKAFLERYRHLRVPDTEVRRAVVEAVKNVTGMDLTIEQLSYSRQVVYAKVSASQRAQLFIHKQKILTETARILGSSGAVPSNLL